MGGYVNDTIRNEMCTAKACVHHTFKRISHEIKSTSTTAEESGFIFIVLDIPVMRVHDSIHFNPMS